MQLSHVRDHQALHFRLGADGLSSDVMVFQMILHPLIRVVLRGVRWEEKQPQAILPGLHQLADLLGSVGRMTIHYPENRSLGIVNQVDEKADEHLRSHPALGEHGTLTLYGVTS